MNIYILLIFLKKYNYLTFYKQLKISRKKQLSCIQLEEKIPSRSVKTEILNIDMFIFIENSILFCINVYVRIFTSVCVCLKLVSIFDRVQLILMINYYFKNKLF